MKTLSERVHEKESAMVGFRMPPQEKELLQKFCSATGQDLSDFIRASLLIRMAKLRLLNPERTKIILNYDEEKP